MTIWWNGDVRYETCAGYQFYLTVKELEAYLEERQDKKRPVDIEKPAPIIGKICCMCKEDKPLDQFYKNYLASDGLDYCCKACAKIKSQKYRVKNSTKPGY